MTDLIVTGVRVVTVSANERACDRAGVASDVWIPTEREERGFAEPIARIADRRLPAALAEGGPDLEDVLRAGVVLVVYLARQGSKMLELRRARRAAHAAVILSDAGAGDDDRAAA